MFFATRSAFVWWKMDAEAVRSKVIADDHNTALTVLNDTITRRQTYLNNLPPPDQAALADSQSELQHAATHIQVGILESPPQSHPSQKQRVTEILSDTVF